MNKMTVMYTNRPSVKNAYIDPSAIVGEPDGSRDMRNLLRAGTCALLGVTALLSGAPAWSQNVPLLDTSARAGSAPATAATSSKVVTVHAAAAVPQAVAPQVVSQTMPQSAPLRRPMRHDDLGRDTTTLLAMQSSGTVAGKELPMLGAEVTNAYKRYLNSFTLPIPKFFDQAVSTKSSGSSQ